MKLPEKIEIFRKFAWKIDFFTRIHDPQIHAPQISNQIDAAVIYYRVWQKRKALLNTETKQELLLAKANLNNEHGAH